MSSRALRKLQGRDLVPFPSENESEEEDSFVEQPSKDVNKFSLLNVSDDDLENEQEEKSSDSDEREKQDVVIESKKKKQRRKKKKRSLVNEAKLNHNDAVLPATLLEDVAEAPSPSFKKKPAMLNKSIFTVEHRYLNPDNELRKIFSSRVLLGDPSFRRRNQGTHFKGVWLSRPSNNWLKLGRTGISMQLIQSDWGLQFYKYEHSRDYQNTQFKFIDVVNSSDHRHFATLLEKQPYHVDALLAFSDVYKVQDDIKIAREFVERALYCLERSFHSCFNITTGTCRLPYKYQENRSLFLALYKHMNFVSQRGCNRTALELCKLLLSLDPEVDPLCCILILDHFGLRSGEYEYLLKFANEWGMHRNLEQLPNWAYSLALAKFFLSKPESTSSEGGSSRSTSSEEANESIQNALIMFPSVLLSLLSKCSVQPDAKVLAHPYFTSQSKESLPQGLALLCHIFVERNFSLWKDQETLSWLETNVNVVLERLENEQKFVRECKNKRNSRYHKPPQNIHRHALLSDLPETGSFLPMSVRTATLLSHDPLPPTDSVVSYQRTTTSHHPSTGLNPFNAFFRSLHPDFSPEIADDTDLEDRTAGGDMRDRVRSLLDAMGDLIRNLTLPVAEDEEQEEEFEQDWD